MAQAIGHVLKVSAPFITQTVATGAIAVAGVMMTMAAASTLTAVAGLAMAAFGAGSFVKTIMTDVSHAKNKSSEYVKQELYSAVKWGTGAALAALALAGAYLGYAKI
jgi:hypothetical protein